MTTFVAIDSQGEDVEIIALGRELERLEKRCLALFLEGKDEESQRLLPPIMALDSRISDIADTEVANAPTVAELWRRRAAALVKAHEAADDDFGPEREQDEIEWAMVRTPSTVRYEVVHKLEAVLQCWFDYGPASDRRDVLLLQSAICDLNFESLK